MTSTGSVGTRRARQTEKCSEGRASGLLAPPSSAAIASYWSPHTPDIPEGFEGAIEDAVVEEPEEVSRKETEYLKADNKACSLTTTIATDDHSVGPSRYHTTILRLHPPTKSVRIPMWPPALVTPARRSEAGSSCRTGRPNRGLDCRHGVCTRYGRRKRDRIQPQSGGEAARIRMLGIVNARRRRRRKGPCKGR